MLDGKKWYQVFLLSIVFFLSMVTGIYSGDFKEMKVWPNGAPDTNGLSGPEQINECIGNISEAAMSIYLPDKSKSTGAAVLVVPGGGYSVVCIEPEGKPIANWLVSRGIVAVVLKYRLPNRHYQVPANDARRAIRTIRAIRDLPVLIFITNLAATEDAFYHRF